MARSHVRFVLIGLALTTLLAACERSQVAADADIAISGKLIAQNGSAVQEAPLVVLTEPTGSDLLFGLPFGLGSLGLACLVDDPPPPCDTRRRVQTGPDGGFRVDLKGNETQGFLGEAATLLVTSGRPPDDKQIGGPAVTGTFKVQTENVLLGDLKLWETDLQIGAEGGTGTVNWQPLPPQGYGVGGAYELVFEQARGRPIWRTTGTPTGGRVDSRVLEDSAGGVAVQAKATAQAPATSLDLVYRSPLVGYLNRAGAPASRSAQCYVVGESGTSTVVAPCGVTDGDLAEEFRPQIPCDDQDTSCGEPLTDLVVDLGKPVPVKLVVVRGCRDGCNVDLSGDGQGYAPLGAVVSPFAALATQGNPSARFVRIQSAGIAGLVEISVWDKDAPGRPAPILQRIDPQQAIERGGLSEGAGGSSGPSRNTALVLAVVLAVAAALVGGFVLGRRRRASTDAASA